MIIRNFIEANPQRGVGMRKQTKLWTTKTGDKIRICDMSDTHLINTIKMLERCIDRLTQESIIGCCEAGRFLHGEQALQNVEDALLDLTYNGIDPSEEIPIYNNLCDEALRRNLDY